MLFLNSILKQVFTAAMGWVQSDITSRRRFIFDVLKYIRLKLVPPKRLDRYYLYFDAFNLVYTPLYNYIYIYMKDVYVYTVFQKNAEMCL